MECNDCGVELKPISGDLRVKYPNVAQTDWDYMVQKGCAYDPNEELFVFPVESDGAVVVYDPTTEEMSVLGTVWEAFDGQDG